MKKLVFFILTLASACNNEDCELWPIPVTDLTCSVVGAGNAIYTGSYIYKNHSENGKRMYEKLGINDAPVVIYNATYGWSISHLFNTNDILYYSNSFGNDPPDLGATQWQVLNGTPPGPTVSIGTLTHYLLLGPCL